MSGVCFVERVEICSVIKYDFFFLVFHFPYIQEQDYIWEYKGVLRIRRYIYKICIIPE